MEKISILILLWLTILAVLDVCLCDNMTFPEDLVKDLYSRLVDAEEKGADVREAALKLNRALQLIREANNNPENKSILLSEAYMLIEDVNTSIPLLIQEGENTAFWKSITICSAAILTAVASVLSYYFGPRIFWEAWLKLRSKWAVEVIKGYRDRSDAR